MVGQQRAPSARRVAALAGPWVVGGIVHHRGAQRVEFDIAVAVHRMRAVFDRAGYAASLPERAGTMVAIVDAADVSSPRRRHHPADRSLRTRCDEQVDVIRHQDMGMDRAAFARGDLPQVRTVAEMVRIREEAWLSIVAAPDDALQGSSTPTPVFGFHSYRQATIIFLFRAPMKAGAQTSMFM